jgi:hypothetical protein
VIDLGAPAAVDHIPLAQHSAGSPDWGTPILLRRFAEAVLRAASFSGAIDLDYASSSYWQLAWPSSPPAAYLDGSEGRDVLIAADRCAAVKATTCGAGFLNAPGLNGGQMLQDCWKVFEEDHRHGWLVSGFWVGYSLEQFSSLQGVTDRHPLSEGIVTIVPSRRARYLAHPETIIGLIEKKMSRRVVGSAEWNAMGRKIETLRQRSDDSPIAGDAPPHSSYLTILYAKERAVRKRQMAATRQFLKAQMEQSKSLLQEVAIIGDISI